MSYDSGNVFARILRGDLPADFVFEDDRCVAFRDLQPQAPVHILIVPRQSLARVGDAEPADAALLGHLLLVAGQIARQEGCGDAFRLVVNHGAAAGQSVFHLHIHLLGGRSFGWPPG